MAIDPFEFPNEIWLNEIFDRMGPQDLARFSISATGGLRLVNEYLQSLLNGGRMLDANDVPLTRATDVSTLLQRWGAGDVSRGQVDFSDWVRNFARDFEARFHLGNDLLTQLRQLDNLIATSDPETADAVREGRLEAVANWRATGRVQDPVTLQQPDAALADAQVWDGIVSGRWIVQPGR